MTGRVEQQRGKLTDDDLTKINARRDRLGGKIQGRYRYNKDLARKAIDDCFDAIRQCE